MRGGFEKHYFVVNNVFELPNKRYDSTFDVQNHNLEDILVDSINLILNT